MLHATPALCCRLAATPSYLTFAMPRLAFASFHGAISETFGPRQSRADAPAAHPEAPAGVQPPRAVRARSLAQSQRRALPRLFVLGENGRPLSHRDQPSDPQR